MPTWYDGETTIATPIVEGGFGWIGEPAFTVWTVDSSTGFVGEIGVPIWTVAGEIVGVSWQTDGGLTFPRSVVTGEMRVGTVFTGRTISIPKISVDGLISPWGWGGSVDFKVPVVLGSLLPGVAFTCAVDIPTWQFDGTTYVSPVLTGTISIPVWQVDGRLANPLRLILYKTKAVNISNGAVTEYHNFQFNSYAYFNGVYLGANSNGIYRLDGDTDAGTKIEARILTGPQDFGINILHKPTDVWLTYRADGELLVLVEMDEEGTIYEIELPTSKRGLHEMRTRQFPRGFDGRFYAFGLRNTSGCDFDVSTLRVIGEKLRRVR